MSLKPTAKEEKVQRGLRAAAKTAVDLSDILFAFGQIKRRTKMPNGEYESDSHHSFTLALISYEIAKQHAPELNAEKVMAYSLVHDLTEIVTGDMPTLLASSEELRQKHERDKRALQQMSGVLKSGPHILALLHSYEDCNDEEAKFVYWLDKTMTILTHFFDDGRNLHDMGMATRRDIESWYERAILKLQHRAADPHKAAAEVLEDLYQKMHDELFESEG